MNAMNVNLYLLAGILLPFLGTTAGAACVFFLRDQLGFRVQKALLGFASGVMVAASVWSLLIPAMNLSAPMGRFAFVPAALGFLLGIAFLLALDHFIPHLHLDADTPEGTPSRLSRSTMLMLAADPVICGGISNVANLVIELSEENPGYEADLVSDAPLFPDAASRRVGWLLDTFCGGAPAELAAYCSGLSSGPSFLSPSSARSGSLNAEWRTIVNEEVDPDV